MVRVLYTLLGFISLLLGIVGIFLPLLPTTPFILLAAFCFMRGSSTMHSWLTKHKVFGPYIHDFQSGLGIPLRTKVIAISVMWASLAFSAWIIPISWVRWLLLIPGIGVSIYLWRMPNKKRTSNEESSFNKESITNEISRYNKKSTSNEKSTSHEKCASNKN